MNRAGHFGLDRQLIELKWFVEGKLERRVVLWIVVVLMCFEGWKVVNMGVVQARTLVGFFSQLGTTSL